MEQCVNTVKELSLELGGNAPFIVFDDADIEMAVRSPRNTATPARPGVCANRIFVQDGVYDA
jgi:succinate-semialdehyde dehydrogenase/glutarate-semialdehyde dehydrogenase